MSTTITNIGLSLLNVSKVGVQTAADNVANAESPGRTRQIMQTKVKSLNGSSMGVELENVIRSVDSVKLKQLRIQTGILQKTQVSTTALNDLQGKFGNPDGSGTIGKVITDMSQSLQKIINNPTTTANKNELVKNAQQFATIMSQTSDSIQVARVSADQGIASAVTRINTILSQINTLNTQIYQANSGNIPPSGYMDERDQLLTDLSQYMDFYTIEDSNGRMDIKLSFGEPLVLAGGGYIPFSYSTTPNIDATISYPTTIGDIILNGQVVTNRLGTGQIAGYLELRDDILPKFQEYLDELTEKVRDQFNSIHNSGTGFPPASTLTGTRTFTNPATDTIQATGKIRVALINYTDLNNNQVAGFIDIDLSQDIAGMGNAFTVNQLRDYINNNLANVTAATNTNQFSLTTALPNHGISIVSLTPQDQVTGSGGRTLSDYLGVNDFFITGNRFNGDPSGRTGLSSLLSVRSDIVSHPYLLSTGKMNNSVTLAIGNKGLLGLDTHVTQDLASLFDTDINFSSAGYSNTSKVTFSQFANNIAHTIATTTNLRKSQFDLQTKIYNQTELVNQSVSGIDPQEELSDMLKYQFGYQLGSAILKVSQEMDTALLNLKR